MSAGYLLDTNAVVEMADDPHSPVARRLAAVPTGTAFTSAVVVAELEYGAEKAADPIAQRAANAAAMTFLRELPFDRTCGVAFGPLRKALEKAGTPMGAYDLMIAATALAYGLTLVTHDAGFRHAARLCNLSLTDWQRP